MPSNCITRSEWEAVLAGRPKAMDKVVTACKEQETHACRAYWLAVNEMRNVNARQKHALIQGWSFEKGAM